MVGEAREGFRAKERYEGFKNRPVMCEFANADIDLSTPAKELDEQVDALVKAGAWKAIRG